MFKILLTMFLCLSLATQVYADCDCSDAVGDKFDEASDNVPDYFDPVSEAIDKIEEAADNAKEAQETETKELEAMVRRERLLVREEAAQTAYAEKLLMGNSKNYNILQARVQQAIEHLHLGNLRYTVKAYDGTEEDIEKFLDEAVQR